MRSERREQYDNRFENMAVAAFQCRQLIDTYHKGAYRRIVRECLDVATYFLDKFVQAFEFLFRRFAVGNGKLVAVEEKIPEFFQEAVHAVDTVGIPRLALFDRSEEHFIEAQRIGSVTLYDVVGIDDVVHRFRHFFYGPAADVTAIFEYELGIFIVGPPVTESLDVENIVAYDVYIYVYGSRFVLTFEIVRDERIGVFDTVHKVGTTLYHTLIDELFERFVFADKS